MNRQRALLLPFLFGLNVIVLWFFYVFFISPNRVTGLVKLLPKSSIVSFQIKNDIKENIHTVLSNILDPYNYTLSVHVDLSNPKSTEHVFYEPHVVPSTETVRDQSPQSNPLSNQVSKLPMVSNKLFNHESLPGFPSFFDRFTISSDELLRREIFAELLVHTYNLVDDTASDTFIHDLNTTDYKTAIQLAVNANLLNVYPNNQFQPKAFVDWATFLTAFFRAQPPLLIDKPAEASGRFSFISPDFWAYDAIMHAENQGWLDAVDFLEPVDPVLVSDAITVLTHIARHTNESNLVLNVASHNQLRTDYQKETVSDSVYFNQTKESFTELPDVVQSISITLLINDDYYRENNLDLVLIEDLIRSVTDLDDSRGDTLIIKPYAFVRQPMIYRALHWEYWPLFLFGLLISLVTYVLLKQSIRFIKWYRRYKQNKRRFIEHEEAKKSKLEQIIHDDATRAFSTSKRQLVNFAKLNPYGLAVKLEQWIDIQLAHLDSDICYKNAAIILLSIDHDDSSLTPPIIQYFSEKNIKKVIQSIQDISTIPETESKLTMNEFLSTFMSDDVITGGQAKSVALIDATFNSQQKHRLFNLKRSQPLEFIQNIPDSQLLAYILDEHPSVSAFMLQFCSDDQLFRITNKIPQPLQSIVLSQFLSVQTLNESLLMDYSSYLMHYFYDLKPFDDEQKNTYLQKATFVFEALPESTRLELLAKNQQSDSTIIQDIQSNMFQFNDITHLSDIDMQRLIHELSDMSVWANALNNAPESVIAHVKANLSDRFNQLFDIEKDRAFSIESTDTDYAQFQVIRTLRMLEKTQEISPLRQSKQGGKL